MRRLRIRIVRAIYRRLGVRRPITRCVDCDRPMVWERPDGKIDAVGITTHTAPRCRDCADSEMASIGSPAYFGTGDRCWTYTAHPLRAVRRVVLGN